MLRLVGIVAGVVLLPSAGASQGTAATAGAAGAPADSAAIALLERRVEDAVVRGDAAFLDSVYAPSFRFKHSTGDLETRAQRMESLRRAVPRGAPGRTIARTIDSVDVEVHGEVALSTGRIHVRRDGGDPRWQDYTVRYVRVYVRGGPDGRWQLLTHHSTGESQGPPPRVHDP
jgi:ketosteroid isomerase-like protein